MNIRKKVMGIFVGVLCAGTIVSFGGLNVAANVPMDNDNTVEAQMIVDNANRATLILGICEKAIGPSQDWTQAQRHTYATLVDGSKCISQRQAAFQFHYLTGYPVEGQEGFSQETDAEWYEKYGTLYNELKVFYKADGTYENGVQIMDVTDIAAPAVTTSAMAAETSVTEETSTSDVATDTTEITSDTTVETETSTSTEVLTAAGEITETTETIEAAAVIESDTTVTETTVSSTVSETNAPTTEVTTVSNTDVPQTGDHGIVIAIIGLIVAAITFVSCIATGRRK